MKRTITHEDDMFKLTANSYSYQKPMIEGNLYYMSQPHIKTSLMKNIGEDWELLNCKIIKC